MQIKGTKQKVASAVVPRRRSGRPTAERVAEIDTAILAAAKKIFFDVGVEAASMDAIAAFANVSKSTLYARYRSKEALFRTVIEDLLTLLSQRAGAQDHLLPDDLESRLRHHARVLISVFGWHEYRLATRLVLNGAHAFPEIEKEWQQRGTAPYLAIISNDIEKAARLSSDGNVDPLVLANLFLHGVGGWYRSELAKGPVGESEAAAYCDKVIMVIMAAIEA
jgi:AcrR family transcriptional regulator